MVMVIILITFISVVFIIVMAIYMAIIFVIYMHRIAVPTVAFRPVVVITIGIMQIIFILHELILKNFDPKQ